MAEDRKTMEVKEAASADNKTAVEKEAAQSPSVAGWASPIPSTTDESPPTACDETPPWLQPTESESTRATREWLRERWEAACVRHGLS